MPRSTAKAIAAGSSTVCGAWARLLLNELLDQVSSRGWITAKVEAGTSASLAVSLAQSLLRALRTASGRHPEQRLRRLLGVFKAFSVRLDPSGSVSLGVDVVPIDGIADSGRFSDDLAALFEVLGETGRELGIGVLVLIDELQEARPAELAALNTAVHQSGQADVPLPLIVVGAGLPSLPAQLAEATSYAERLYDFRTIGLLDDAAARLALTVPAAERSVAWDGDGLDTAVRTAGGYPYFIQAIGKHVWDNARTSAIEAEDVEVGLAEARREVDDGLYRPAGSGRHPRSGTSCGRWPLLEAMGPRRSPTSPGPWARAARQTSRWPATS